MATVTRKCKDCGRRFRVSNQSRRLYCEACRPSRAKPLAEAPVAPPRGQHIVGEVERVARAELERGGRLETLPGVLACRTARRLDDGSLTAAQEPAWQKQLQTLMREAMLGVQPQADWVDDLSARRKA